MWWRSLRSSCRRGWRSVVRGLSLSDLDCVPYGTDSEDDIAAGVGAGTAQCHGDCDDACSGDRRGHRDLPGRLGVDGNSDHRDEEGRKEDGGGCHQSALRGCGSVDDGLFASPQTSEHGDPSSTLHIPRNALWWQTAPSSFDFFIL